MKKLLIGLTALLALTGSAMADSYYDFLSCDFSYAGGKDKKTGDQFCTSTVAILTSASKTDVFRLTVVCNGRTLYQGGSSVIIFSNPITGFPLSNQGETTQYYTRPPLVEVSLTPTPSGYPGLITWYGYEHDALCRVAITGGMPELEKRLPRKP